MNKKRKILTRLALALALITVLSLTLVGCASNGITVQENGLAHWAGSSSEQSSTESESVSSTESESETEAVTDSEGNVVGGEETDPEEDADDEEADAPASTQASGKNAVTVSETKGFLDQILYFIGTFLRWITQIMPARSYILTLFIFAIILEFLFLPFSIKQQKNSIKQAMLRPKEMALRKKYAGRTDRATQQKLSMEIQELYRKENYNAMAGCLPLLIQLPIIIILYSVVVDPIKHVMGYSSDFTSFIYYYLQKEGVTAGTTSSTVELLSKIVDTPIEKFSNIGLYCSNPDEVLGAIKNIKEVAPNFNIGPISFGLTPAFNPASAVQYWLLVIPVLTFVIYFFSMKINRKLSFQPAQSADSREQACSNNMMDITMPLMSVWMTFIVPAAVGVYWMFKSIVGVGKQFILSKAMPLPTFTEEDYKAAEKELAGKQQPKKIVKSENVGKVRSLHHIDDEDYDEDGNYNPKTPEPAPVEEAEETIADNRMTSGAALKDETDKGDAKEKKAKKRAKKSEDTEETDNKD